MIIIKNNTVHPLFPLAPLLCFHANNGGAAYIIFTEEDSAVSQITKRALEQSLKNLLLQKPITKITINDIAEDGGINRMTFYYHFKDIYDLVEWSCEEDARKAI